jgi:hypothetical protein
VEELTASDAYRLGVPLHTMPAPIIAEHAVDVPAGPLRFVVESRFLADDMAMLQFINDPSKADTDTLDDGGASVHVFGARDGMEHLRFDCFDKHPHYHYIRNSEQVNQIVRFDQIAMGDPIEWTQHRLRERLPEMLEYTGVGELAAEVRKDPVSVDSAVAVVAQLLSEAQDKARSRRLTASQ